MPTTEWMLTLRHEPASVRLDIDGLQVRGRLDDLHEAGICRLRFAKLRSVDLLSGWIRHLILCALRPTDAAPTTVLLFKNDAVRFGPVENPLTPLSTLLGYYRVGLRRPLPLFPRTSETYARSRIAGVDRREALGRARRTWRSDFGHSESDDAYYRFCFRDWDPLDEEFCEVAESIWPPLLTCAEPFTP